MVPELRFQARLALKCSKYFIKDTLVSNQRSSLPESLFIGEILMKVLLIFAGHTQLALNIRTDLPRKSTIDLLEQDFSHFGFPHTLVTDNAPCFTFEEFKRVLRREREIFHLTGAPYHPSTNGAAERLVQTFKQALRKSAQLPKKALLGFLRQYKRYFYDRQIVDSLLASYLMVDKYARIWMQYYLNLLTSCKASR